MAGAGEIALEQKFFDQAAELREEYRESMHMAPTAAAHKGAASGLRRAVQQIDEQIGAPSDAVAVGRMDLEDDETFYVGRYPIFDHGDAVVVSWKSDVSRAYYEATRGDPHGLRRRRQFTTEANTVIDFDEIIFAELVERIGEFEEPVSDLLLSDLLRHRTGEMHDIVATI